MEEIGRDGVVAIASGGRVVFLALLESDEEVVSVDCFIPKHACLKGERLRECRTSDCREDLIARVARMERKGNAGEGIAGNRIGDGERLMFSAVFENVEQLQ